MNDSKAKPDDDGTKSSEVERTFLDVRQNSDETREEAARRVAREMMRELGMPSGSKGSSDEIPGEPSSAATCPHIASTSMPKGAPQMTTFDPNEPWVSKAVQHWADINAELQALEGKHDPESEERREELLEQLMCADMNLGPMKRAMVDKPDIGDRHPPDQR